MAVEPTTSEEYIRLVQAQAEEQSEERVVSHQELLQKSNADRQYYKEKMRFYTFLLVLVVLSYLAVRVMPILLGSDKGDE